MATTGKLTLTTFLTLDGTMFPQGISPRVLELVETQRSTGVVLRRRISTRRRDGGILYPTP
jgi:hypothetical protein